MGAVSVGHGELGFGRIAEGVTALGEDLRGGESAYTVDLGEGGS